MDKNSILQKNSTYLHYIEILKLEDSKRNQ